MNNKYKILLVEDELNISRFVTTLLETNGYQVINTVTAKDALMMFSSHLPDLVILDLGLPDADGTEVLKEIRKEYMTPVIVLSARSDENDKVTALDCGANDYVTKPFGSAELLARVRGIIRFNKSSNSTNGKFTNGGLTIDYDTRNVYLDGNDVKLTQTEFNILVYLAKHFGKVLTYSAIIKEIWGVSDYGSTKKLQVNMANIRKKLGIKPGENRFISNELGVGYKMHEDNDNS